MFTTPEEVEYAFYDAMRQADLTLMMRVWADDDDIACIHPGGWQAQGHMAVKTSWQQAFALGPINVQPAQPFVISGLMSAVHILIEQLAQDASPGSGGIGHYATNVYHKGPGGWKMVLHHASTAPGDAGLLDLRFWPDTLH